MRTALNCFFATCAALTLAVLVLFICELWQNGWSFSGADSDHYKYREEIITEDFSRIIINLTTEDVTLLPSENDECKLVTFEKVSRPHTAKVEDGALVITYTDKGSLYDKVRLFNFAKTYTTIYLPKQYYNALAIGVRTGDVTVGEGIYYDSASIALTTGDVSFFADALVDLEITGTTGDVEISSSNSGDVRIATTTGNVKITDSIITSLDLSLSTGDVAAEGVTVIKNAKIKGTSGESTLTEFTAGNLYLKKSTGKTTLEHVYADEILNVETTTGKVTLCGTDAGEISIKTTTGSINGSILSEKEFLARSASGSVNVPDTSGPICRLETTSGSIKIIIGG